MTFYTINLLIYAAVDAMACLGLSQQFGIAGVTNFGFIIFQAAGGYTAAILAMPPQTANGGFQTYIGGWNLPFPLPWIGAAIVGGVIALPFTFLVGRRLRGDFAAVGLLVTAVLLNLVVTNYRPLLNGDAGLSLIPQPLQGQYNPATASYQWVFAAVAIAACLGVYLFVRRITESPYGRSLRAMRDNDMVADSLGKSLLSMRTVMLVVGGAIAGLSGGVLVSYITTWSPAAWGYAETVVLFAAVIIGGAGNHLGAVLGAILVPVGFEEVTRFIPTSNNLPPNLIPSLEWVAIGLLIVIFLWVRPQGILPERKRVIRAGPVVAGDGAPASGGTAGWPTTSEAASVVPEARAESGDGGERYARGAPHQPSPAAAAPSGGASPDADGQPGAPGSPAPLADADGRSSASRPDAPPPGPIPVPPLADVAGGSTRDDAGSSARSSGAVPLARPGEVVLEAVSVSRDFGGVRAVDDVSFSVRAGTLTGLIGPNGAGKSTLLAMLAGTLPVSSGRVIYRGQDVTGLAVFRRARLGLVRFGLEGFANHYAGDLSGGQRRLVEIMRALMAEPGMLLLDEPMAGVHPNLARRIGDQLVALCAEGMTILMVEHELAIMDEFCDPVVVMAEGAVLAEGTMAQLRGRQEVVEAYLVG